jgi:hypothetical protein
MSNKLIRVLCCVALIVAVAFGVQWQKDSAPFSYPEVGIKHVPVGKGYSLTYSQIQGKNRLILRYSIPREITGAVIDIHTTNGALVKSFPVSQKVPYLIWDMSANVVAGTYVAALRVNNEAGMKLKVIIIK